MKKKTYVKDDGLKKYFDKIFWGTKEEFYKDIENSIEKEEKRFIVTANPETIMISEENEELKKCILSDVVTVVPDGIGIIKGAKFLKYPAKDTITGINLTQELLRYCNLNKKSVFLFGAKDEVIHNLEKRLNDDYPDLKILGIQNGYEQDKKAVFEKIKEVSPDLILVALGIPAQEILINENYKDFEKGIFIGVGGSFDVLSGLKKRAPRFFIKFHLEWLYRITTEPKRLKRFFNSNIKYVLKLVKEK